MALISFRGSPHGGDHKLLPEWNRQAPITPTIIIDHSIVGSALGAWYYFRDQTGLESHFIVQGAPSGSQDGRIWQLMDTGRRADANLDANAFAISIETEDNGDPDHFPWSGAQLASLWWLHAKLRAVHPDATGSQVRPSQEWLVETLLDIQAKLDQLLGAPAAPGEAGERPT